MTFPAFNDAIARIQALEGLPERVAERAALGIKDVLDEQFALGVDPYGNPWADLARGGHSYLTETGEMHAGSMVYATGGEIAVMVPDPGGFHQSGTRYMPARKLEPERSLPPAYEVAILQAVADEGITKDMIHSEGV